jgi:hypothetical protein
VARLNFYTRLDKPPPIEVATEIFTRINTKGTELTLFEIMVAKTYDQEREFDLAREYDRLVDSNDNGKDLEDAGYDTIPSSAVLQCVAAHLAKQVRRRDILKMNKGNFIDAWPVVKDSIFTAVDYFRTQFRIPVSELLPYPVLLVPFTYFFINNFDQKPTPRQNKLLAQYFWWASLSNRFSGSIDSKLAQDLERMDQIHVERQPSYQGEEFRLTMEDLRWHWFSTGDAFCKAILCLYSYQQPRSFDSDAPVRIDNSWLKVANSKNYHHFFPRSFLRKQGFDDKRANSVLNVTIVDDYLNKRTIGAKAPSDYMDEFFKKNRNLAATMQTHLIGDLDDYGISTDDYELFIEQRGQRVLRELNERLNPELD